VLIWYERKRQGRRYRKAGQHLAYIVRIIEENRTVREQVRRALFDGDRRGHGRGRG
jgi:hypothetical protein